MFAEKMPSQFGDALGAFWGVGCTDEDSQIGQQFQSLQPLLKASTETCSQVALPIRENLSVSSAPVKAWNWKAGKAFFSLLLWLSILALSSLTPEATEIDMFFDQHEVVVCYD